MDCVPARVLAILGFLASRAGWAVATVLRVLVQIREYEQVIIEDRIEKEKTRKKLEQDDLELKSIVKVGCTGSRRAWQADCSSAAHRQPTDSSQCWLPIWGEEINESKASFQP